MDHYFIYDKDQKVKLRTVSFSFDGTDINLETDTNTFSNKHLDDGTRILIKNLLETNLNGSFLDLGSGYGPIGLTLKLIYKDLDVTLSDINEHAVELCKINAKKLNLNVECIASDSYSNIHKSFDIVSLNSPISCGKEVCYKMYRDTLEHLKNNGLFYLVIRKDKGALSHMKYLSSLFPSVRVIYKEKGYLVILANKNETNIKEQ